MAKRQKPTAPDHLRPTTAEWFTGVLDDFELDAHHIRLLTLAAEAWDRCQAAREIVDAEGLIVLDRFGQQKQHPAIAIERDARVGFCRVLRELALDIDEPADSRPPTIAANTRKVG